MRFFVFYKCLPGHDITCVNTGLEIFSTVAIASLIAWELASTLQNAPDGNIKIRLTTESGGTIDSEIGKQTVKAWRTVYANAVSVAQ